MIWLFLPPRLSFRCLIIPALFLLGNFLPLTTFSVLAQPATPRIVPNTATGIHIWNDQLLPRAMSEEQIKFAATHYDGTQKILRADADKLRSYNPNFLVLHYRLGQMLGYRQPQGNCQLTGDVIRVIEGNQWVPEYPGDQVVQENWFYHYGGVNRIFLCGFGAYLMDTDDAAWRNYWLGEVAHQLAANDDDGVFMDSTIMPSYLGGFNITFPAVDLTFEKQWSDKMRRWLVTAKQQIGSRYLLIPNIGHWVTTRDGTDFSPADGVFIEGFGKWDQYSALELADWQLQMNRLLNLERQDKIVIVQSYLDGASDLTARNFYVANYLLIKGSHSFLNLELGLDPEWFPEYDIPIGSPVDAVPANVDGWRDATTRLYRRVYSNGLVLVNPTSATQTYNLGKNYYLAQASGGGYLPASGVPDGTLNYQATPSVTLAPATAAILLNSLNKPVANVSAASYLGPNLAGESIVSAFGTNLATGTQVATSLPLPTTLAGTTVKIRDSVGTERPAALFYVSPTQINYQIPLDTVPGLATVTITASNNAVVSGTMPITKTSPGLFSAESTGQGLAAAQVQRVRSGVSTFEAITHFDTAQNRIVAVPCDLGPVTDQVYLALYGTGVRNRSALSAVTGKIGGVDAQVVYAGSQNSFVGVDQINLLIPRSLAGRGEVQVNLTVDGQVANTVRVNIR